MKTILKFFLLIVLLLSFSQLDAQDKLYKDRVYLKNGSLLVGSIDRYSPGEEMVLSFENGHTLTFSDDKIRKVVMHKGKSTKEQSSFVPITSNRFFHEAQLGFLTNTDGVGYSLSYNLLYQKSQLLAFGGGVGIDNFYASVGREIFPVYANARYNLRKGGSAPFVGMKLGYGMAFSRESQNITDAQGGLMTNPYFGIRLGSRGMIVNLFSGIKFQKADYVIENSWETRREDILHRRLELGASVMF